MIRRMIVACVLILGIGRLVSSKEVTKPIGTDELRASSAKAIKAIQHSQVTWFQKQNCSSCHHQLLPEITFKLARERSIPIDEKAATEHTGTAFEYLKDIDSIVQGYDYIDVYYDGLYLVAANAAGIKPTLALAASAQFVAARQLTDGGWPTFDNRPPQSYSRFAATATCALALQKYLPASLQSEKESRLKRARAWLLKTQPHTTEERAFQLLGLLWTESPLSVRQRLAQQLIAQQREDGGWSELPNLASDAYSTGEVLSALHDAAGIATTTNVYQRGLRFLLNTQQQDGTWRVKTRINPPAPVSPPYFNSDFPYEKDQFISIMGTNWGLTAMLNAIAPSARVTQKFASAEIASGGLPEWVRATLTGSTGELKRLLDGGMDPNSKTVGGTSALMLAARDPQKVKLLLERGADVNARATSGFTALMVASRYRGNGSTVQMLLNKGAKPNNEKGVEVRNEATALFFAATAGDVEIIKMLLDAGARQTDSMKLLGTFYTTPLSYAISNGDEAATEYLLQRGGNPNDIDRDNGISLVGWAVIGNRPGPLRALIAHGARVNPVDKLGMTPLLYAVSIDFGDTAVIEKLIAAGADLGIKSKEGLTALELAQKYQHPRMTSLLSAKMASR